MQQAESSASRRRGLASEQPTEPSRQEREVSVHPKHAQRNNATSIVNALSTTVNLKMPVTTSSSVGGANTVTVQLEATTTIEAGTMTAQKIEVLHPSHRVLGFLARPFTK
jgi:hypothetical protein